MYNSAAFIQSKFIRLCTKSMQSTSAINLEFTRSVSISSALYGRRNFRKFIIHDRGTPLDRKFFRENPELVDQRGARPTGYWENKKFIEVPDMIPQLVVPDLSNFKLKPYVSYRTADISQEKFTPEHLFYAAYAKKIANDFKENKLDNEGNPLEPSEEEKMGPEEAWQKARSSGSDLFG